MRAATGAPATVADGQQAMPSTRRIAGRSKRRFPRQPRRGSGRSCSKLSPDSRSTSNGGSSACRHRSFWCTERATSFAPTTTTARNRMRPSSSGNVPSRRSCSSMEPPRGNQPATRAASLTFYGLMDDGVSGESVGLPLAGETGLLVAFPSHLVHSVSPVTAGERYTLVSWFFEDPSLPVSDAPRRCRQRPAEVRDARGTSAARVERRPRAGSAVVRIIPRLTRLGPWPNRRAGWGTKRVETVESRARADRGGNRAGARGPGRRSDDRVRAVGYREHPPQGAIGDPLAVPGDHGSLLGRRRPSGRSGRPRTRGGGTRPARVRAVRAAARRQARPELGAIRGRDRSRPASGHRWCGSR